MGKLKSERHHWWPECVSRCWADEKGGVHWLRHDDSVTCTTPNNFGLIKNGHHIKLSPDPSTPSPWDESFEAAFQTADGNFPNVIAWLEGLPHAVRFGQPMPSRMVNHEATDEQFSKLIECIISLAVRSPMHRDVVVRTAEQFRGTIHPKERSALIGLNIRHSLQDALRQIGGRGKVMVVFSPEKEFIFGDGFFNNLTPPFNHLFSPKLLVPLTPRMAVLFTRPSSFNVLPRLVTFVASEQEAQALNLAVHIYAKEAIYYRTDRPAMTEHFAKNQHLVFPDQRNPVDRLMHEIPGVSPW